MLYGSLIIMISSNFYVWKKKKIKKKGHSDLTNSRLWMLTLPGHGPEFGTWLVESQEPTLRNEN